MNVFWAAGYDGWQDRAADGGRIGGLSHGDLWECGGDRHHQHCGCDEVGSVTWGFVKDSMGREGRGEQDGGGM